MKIKYVYHGSARKLTGEKLVPKRARDVDGKPENILRGVYASDIIDEAIAMGILSCKGVKGASCGVHRQNSKMVDAIIYDGWPLQDYFYLYTLASKNFENRPDGSHQWVSPRPVKPEKIEKLSIRKYLHLIRKATKKEKERWFNQNGAK